MLEHNDQIFHNLGSENDDTLVSEQTNDLVSVEEAYLANRVEFIMSDLLKVKKAILAILDSFIPDDPHLRAIVAGAVFNFQQKQDQDDVNERADFENREVQTSTIVDSYNCDLHINIDHIDQLSVKTMFEVKKITEEPSLKEKWLLSIYKSESEKTSRRAVFEQVVGQSSVVAEAWVELQTRSIEDSRKYEEKKLRGDFDQAISQEAQDKILFSVLTPYYFSLLANNPDEIKNLPKNVISRKDEVSRVDLLNALAQNSEDNPLPSFLDTLIAGVENMQIDPEDNERIYFGQFIRLISGIYQKLTKDQKDTIFGYFVKKINGVRELSGLDKLSQIEMRWGDNQFADLMFFPTVDIPSNDPRFQVSIRINSGVPLLGIFDLQTLDFTPDEYPTMFTVVVKPHQSIRYSNDPHVQEDLNTLASITAGKQPSLLSDYIRKAPYDTSHIPWEMVLWARHLAKMDVNKNTQADPEKIGIEDFKRAGYKIALELLPALELIPNWQDEILEQEQKEEKLSPS